MIWRGVVFDFSKPMESIYKWFKANGFLFLILKVTFNIFADRSERALQGCHEPMQRNSEIQELKSVKIVTVWKAIHACLKNLMAKCCLKHESIKFF